MCAEQGHRPANSTAELAEKALIPVLLLQAGGWHMGCSTATVRLDRRGAGTKAETTEGAAFKARSDTQKEPVMANGITTSSIIAMWYLTRMRGRRVAYRIIRPRFVLPGIVVYASTWVLVPA